jgi:AcrR family transcriptional regulator
MNREEKKRVTRENISNAAIELFAEHGYDATTINQITERAGVGKGTFFNYFACKEDLLCDMEVMWAVEEVRRIKDKPGLLIPHIRVLIMQIDQRFQLSRPLMLALCQGVVSSPNAVQNQLEQIDELIGAFTEVIEEGQRRGEFTRLMPAGQIAEMAIQTYLGTRLYWAMGRGDDNFGSQMAITFELFLKSLAP